MSKTELTIKKGVNIIKKIVIFSTDNFMYNISEGSRYINMRLPYIPIKLT